MGLSWQERFDRTEGASRRWHPTASNCLAASLSKQGASFSSLFPLDRRAPVIGFDGIFRPSGGGPAEGGVLRLGSNIEATALGQVTSASRSCAKSADVQNKEARSTLQVRVHAAHGLRTSEPSGEDDDILDPYVVVRAGTHEWQTPALTNDGDPVWTTENEFKLETDEPVELLLELEVMNASGQHSLGKAVLSMPDLCKGVWHRRRMPLDVSAGELSVEVRCDTPHQQPHCQSSKAVEEASMHSMRYMHYQEPMGLVRPSAPELLEEQARGEEMQIRVPLDWADLQDSGDEFMPKEPFAGMRTAAESRSRTFCAPQDLFGEARLEVPDPTSGPALSLRQALDNSQSAPSRPYARLASLQEERQSTKSALSTRGAVGDKSSAEADDAAVQKALSKQKSVNQAAQEELQRVLKKLKELEETAVAKAREALVAPSPPAAPSPLAAPAPPAAPSPQAAPLASPPPVPPPVGATAALPASSQTGPEARGADAAAAVPQAAPAVASAKSLATTPNPGPGLAASSQAEVAAAVPPGKPKPANYQDRFENAAAIAEKVEESIKDFQEDPNRKDFRWEVKKSLRHLVTSISASSKSVKDTVSKMEVLLQKYCQDPLNRDFVEFTLASYLASQAKSQATEPWPIAEVACRIFVTYPNVQEILTGLLWKECPALSTAFRTEPERSTEEEFDVYRKSAVAMHKFILAVSVIQGDLGAVWHWLARTLNQRPVPLGVIMLYAALESVGADAQARYKRQFDKLIAYVDNVFMAEVEDLATRIEEQVGHDHVRQCQSQLSTWIAYFKGSGKAKIADGRFIKTSQESALSTDL